MNAGKDESQGPRGSSRETRASLGRFRADLSGADLRQADLRRARFEGTELFGANLLGADLSFATGLTR